MSQSSDQARLVSELKRRAKQLARQGQGSYMQCLERLSKRAGYSGWWELQRVSSPKGARSPTGPAPTGDGTQPYAHEPVRFAIDPKWANEIADDRLNDKDIVRDWDWLPPGEDSWEHEGTFAFFHFTGPQPRSAQEVIDIVGDLFFFPPERIWLGGEEVPATSSVFGNLEVTEIGGPGGPTFFRVNM